jgi:type II secretory pathway pseudopilin PulG
VNTLSLSRGTGDGRGEGAVDCVFASRRLRGSAAAFTLLEIILGIAIMAIVMVAINAVFFTAMRLREHTIDALEAALPVEHSLAIIRRDLQGIVSPTPVSTESYALFGHFRAGGVVSYGSAYPAEIEFCTTTAVLRENEPWPEVQRVTYSLRPGGDRSVRGQDLVRGVTRNILATVPPQPEEEWMMSGVETVEFACYDGIQWRTMWDTEVTDTNLPTAVRLRILFANQTGTGPGQPMEMLVPIFTQTVSNLTSTAEEEVAY